MMASRVLVIDDSTTLRKLVEIAMRGTGIDIDFAATGSDGIVRAREAKPDVILLDYLLPDLESTEVCQLLSDDTTTAKVPVVVMSANQASIFESFKRFPAVVDFVGKPFSPSEIRTRLETAMKGGVATPTPVARLRPRTRQTIAPATHPELSLAGSLYTTPLLDVLRLLGASNATGTLLVDLQRVYRVYIRRGDVVMCTASADGKPALLAQAQAGNTHVAELPVALHRDSIKLLDEMLGNTAGRFSWQGQVGLPDYVEAFGRTVSVTSIALARQRRSQHVPLSAKFLDEIYDRTPRFSEKLAGSRLEAIEQRLLALIDGRTSVREILARAEISSDRAAAVFARLKNVDLIRNEHASSVMDIGGGLVAILDDDPTFVAAVRAHLAKRASPIEVAIIDDATKLASTALEKRARMVLVNAAACTPEVVSRELAVLASTGAIELVAVVDTPDRAAIDAMIAAGMHAVLVKPIHVNDLERLLSTG